MAPGKNTKPYLKNNLKTKRARDVAQVVQGLLDK
jgi:hypothetical protein